MFSRYSLLGLCLCLWPLLEHGVQAKTCKSMDVRSSASQFQKLKNCTRIVGFLKLVLLEDIARYPTFPQLREVTEYVLVFMTANLYNLGDVFPNLIAIRGNRLLKGNALIIHHNNQIRKIGLSNLLRIQNGYVHVGKSPNLCYVNTVNWTALGTSLSKYSDVAKCKREECAPDCNGHCWSPGKCQLFNDDNCHPECLGCTKSGSSKHCLVCKNFKDGDNCVNVCPKAKFTSIETFSCVTEQQCLNLQPRAERWVFADRCLPIDTCPENYEIVGAGTSATCRPCLGACTRVCNSAFVETKEDVEYIKGCTHIDGHLELRITDSRAADQLEEGLRSIKEIDGCLKIARSDAIGSLKFMRSLRKITGRDKHRQCNNHTVFVYENANLKGLPDIKDHIETSSDVSLGFHNNPELCVSEIERFAAVMGITKKSFDAILKDAKDISPYSNGDKAPCADLRLNVSIAENNPTNVTLVWKISNDVHNLSIIGYTVFYIPRAGLVDENVQDDVCDKNGWTSLFVSNNSVQLTQLLPFTAYVYWIKIYHIGPDSASGVGASTEKKNFTTAPDDPSQPLSFEITKTTSTSISLTWEPPEKPNGKLAYYRLIVFEEKDDPTFVYQRNYCKHPHAATTVQVPRPLLPSTTTPSPVDRSNGTCSCEPKIFKINDTFCGPSIFGPAFATQDCNKYTYEIVDKPKKLVKRYLLETKTNKLPVDNETIIDIKLTPNSTAYTLSGLRAYTLYVVLFSACNEPYRQKPQCSAVLFSSRRTPPNTSSDKISGMYLRLIGDRDARLTWTDPQRPNGMIVAYHIEHKADSESRSSYVPECITRMQHVRSGYAYRARDLEPGQYTIRVRPITLSGPGIYSDPIHFVIKSPVKVWLLYMLAGIAVAVAVAVAIAWRQYRNRVNMDNVRLFATINPEYESVIYVEDGWEMDRDDIEIGDFRGQGLFGKVYDGMIKSRSLPCAIKTVNGNATMVSKVDFLNESSVMKKFSGAHHVVKLYGVVSRGGDPLVVMELMERGDLKEYLRRSREIPRNGSGISAAEMYLMAAQIADGMAYLSAKKFVHRDLAARNCMVAGDGTVKIGDFGMTKDIYETDYYKSGKSDFLPVRWMSPESLADGVYTSETDAWSYGVTLWEIVTLGQQPYQGLSNRDVLKFVTARGRLSRPSDCPDILWEIMRECWRSNPDNRPAFAGIVQKLEPLLGPSFALVSFCHSREGLELRFHSNRPPFESTRLMGDDEDFCRQSADGQMTSFCRSSSASTRNQSP